MKIEILGTGCPKCKALQANVEKAVKELKIEAEIIKVTRLNDIMNYGVMLTPALVINGKVKNVGKALTVEDIKKLIT
ncbi:thioredoxin family protein [bacterium]|nr:thioredoxin family protein [bacterium]